MARRPKASPSPNAAAAVAGEDPIGPDAASAPTGRGRRPKAAALGPELVSVMDRGDAAADDVAADGPARKASDTPARGRGGRKPKQAAIAALAPPPQNRAKQRSGRMSSQPKTEPEPEPEASASAAPVLEAAHSPETAANAAAARLPFGPSNPADEAAVHPSSPDTPAPAEPAAHWDRTTDTARFDWPGIERTARQAGPNQGMAKLLIAARAEGAHSRWPF